jgi:NhaP-type Na+/H+ and K+/H+ antiporter
MEMLVNNVIAVDVKAARKHRMENNENLRSMSASYGAGDDWAEPNPLERIRMKIDEEVGIRRAFRNLKAFEDDKITAAIRNGEREFVLEAYSIAEGRSLLLPTREHLKALIEKLESFGHSYAEVNQ